MCAAKVSEKRSSPKAGTLRLRGKGVAEATLRREYYPPLLGYASGL
jgi:hypothetical protein